jgi:hypothetical protein
MQGHGTLHLAALAALLAGTACARNATLSYAPRTNAATWEGRRAVGCWQFSDPPRRIAERLPANRLLEFSDQPSRDEMDSLAPKAFVIRAVPGPDSAHSRRISGWALDSAKADRVHVWLGDGFTGVRLFGRLHGDTLSGRARSHVDYSPSLTWRGSFIAVRAQCPRDQQ